LPERFGQTPDAPGDFVKRLRSGDLWDAGEHLCAVARARRMMSRRAYWPKGQPVRLG
jgi:hypothetical protein